MPDGLRVVLTVIGLLLALFGAGFIVYGLLVQGDHEGDDEKPTVLTALGFRLEVNQATALLVLGVAIAVIAWVLPGSSDDAESDADADVPPSSVTPPTSASVDTSAIATTPASPPSTSARDATTSPDETSRTDEPTTSSSERPTTSAVADLEVSIVDGSIGIAEDRTNRSNLPLGPDGEDDLAVTVRFQGGPTGIIATVCNSPTDHTYDQWDTYTGQPPDRNAPIFGPDRSEPTYQLAVVGGNRTVNPNVDLEAPLEDGVYQLFMPLFSSPTDRRGLCVTAIRESAGRLEHDVDYRPYDFPAS